MKVHRAVIRLSAAHFFVDSYSSMLGAFLPFLHDELNLSLTQAGILGGCLIVSGSLLQPIYGYLADRFPHQLFAALGPAVAGIFISSLGLAPNFPALMVLVILGGIGVAMFHPQGAAAASRADEQGRGFQLSVFITVGIIGYSIGPVYVTSVILLAGLKQSYWAALPGIAISLYLLLRGSVPVEIRRRSRQGLMLRQVLKRLRPLLLLYFLVVIRSALHLVFVAFLPLYFTGRGFGEFRSSQFLTLFLFVGGVFGFLGGVLSDRIGGKTVICLSILGFIPALLGFLLTQGLLSVVLCALGGGFLLLTLSVNVAMAQKLVPEGASTVSALMMGFAWGIGGAAVPLVGVLSDQFGFQPTLIGLVLCSLSSLPLALALPTRRGMEVGAHREVGSTPPLRAAGG